MHTILKQDRVRVIRFDEGDEIISGLRGYCDKAGIHSGSFTAIGAAEAFTLSSYDVSRKIYNDKSYEGIWEIVSLSGNVSTLSGSIVVHAHAVLAEESMAAVGGHLKKCMVSATCEMTLHVFEGRMERETDEGTGLGLLR